jgi:hypothetical protein
MGIAHRHMNVAIGTVAALFFLWVYLVRIFGIDILYPWLLLLKCSFCTRPSVTNQNPYGEPGLVSKVLMHVSLWR